MGTSRSLLRLAFVVLVLTAASTSLASGGGPLTASTGHTVTCLLDQADLRALSEWDLDHVWIGYTRSRGTPNHRIAADEDGVAYVIARGHDDPSTDPDYLTTVIGIVSVSDGESPDTVYQLQYDGNGDYLFPQALGIASFDVGGGSAWIDTGDVVLMSHSLRDSGTSDETWGTIIQAFDPDNASGTMRTIFETESFSASEMLLDPSTDSIILPRAETFERIAYDPAAGFVMTTTTFGTTFPRAGLIWAIDEDGDLYTDTYGTVIKSNGKEKDDWRISRLSGVDGSVLDEKFADPVGSPNNYYYHKMGGFAFDANGKLWVADWKKGKSPDGFISKANNKGKIPYKKRVVGWSRDGAAPDTGLYGLHFGQDGLIYTVSHTGPAGVEAVWVID